MAEVFDVPDERRYVLTVEGRRVGRLDYAVVGDVFVATHVVVEPAYEGQGLGSTLVRHVLDEVGAAGLRLRPECPFVGFFVRQHPEYARLLEDVEPERDEVS